MWLFTKYGFYSAVCARQGDGSRGQPVNPDRIMVRARVCSHLDALKARIPDQLGHSEIAITTNSDYACRIFIEKASWQSIVADLAAETDYDNFKSEVSRHQGREGAAYEHSLHDVWSVMYKLQK